MAKPLMAKATAGVYVGGGIAPRILPLLAHGEFVKAFRAKGRLGSLLEKIPVRVILEPRTALRAIREKIPARSAMKTSEP